VKFKLDENLSKLIRTTLVGLGHDAQKIEKTAGTFRSARSPNPAFQRQPSRSAKSAKHAWVGLPPDIEHVT
jgi:hypothetical protein